MAPPTNRSLFSAVLLLTVVLVGAEWIAAPRRLTENQDYTGYDHIARIRSDKENYTKILYFLSGPGVDQDPKNVFGIDTNTGYVRVYSILDREKIAYYQLQGIAKYMDHTVAEKNILLNITVVDENDCTPVIKIQQAGSVSEASAKRTLVMKVVATDDDQENTPNSQIFYSIAEQSNSAGMFKINPATGEVFVERNTLDRETKDTYKLIIKASDLGGRAGGNTGTGEITINILDINDNVPTLEKESYVGSVQENTVNVEVLRIRAVDLDLMYTDNWLAVFEFVSGNEAGFFSITTDTKTNEGIIMIRKSLDYEELKVVNLKVAISNKAAYNFGSGAESGGGMIQKYYPITINVVNQKEGPRFHPSVKVVTISEDHTSINLNQIITTYAAIDTDTSMIATNVRYAKLDDIDGWLIIDQRTADIKLSKLPDRESKYLINGTYYAKIICITNEVPSKTATGTIAIQVEDFNDHCPTLTSTTHTMCYEDNFIYVTAIDQDEFPNSAPFEYTVVEGTSWNVEPFNETTVILRDQTRLWPGIHKVVVEIKDQQGKSCADMQTMDVVVCTCQENTKTCVSRSGVTTTFGAAGVLLLLLGLLLLLLVPLLLLFCLCGGAAALENMKPIAYETKQQLISYHTEGQGEDKAIPLISTSVEVVHAPVEPGQAGKYASKQGHGGHPEYGAGSGGMTTEKVQMYSQHQKVHGHGDYVVYGMGTGQSHYYSQRQFGAFDGMALSDTFLGNYFLTKSNHAAKQVQTKDSMLVYDFEGRGSPTGSVGCCSLLENDNDLSFLNDLGPKFKTLAEICRGSALVTESIDARVSIPPPRPVSPVRPSTSSHTYVHTQGETIRDHITSGSTMIQEETITERSHGLATVQDKIMVPSQTVLVQQPTMYYTAQPMYVVEPKPQVVLVAGGAQQAVGQVGLPQGVVQVSGLQAPQGMILVDSQVGGSTSRASQGSVTRSRQIVVENGSSGGEQVAQVSKGFVQMHHGLAGQGFEVSGQGQQVKSSSMSRGFVSSSEDVARLTTPKSHGSQRVVVQHKKVSVTERNVE